MSAIRKAPGVYIDPYTGCPVAVTPTAAPVSGPVELVVPARRTSRNRLRTSVTDAAVIAALRASSGNAAAAGRSVGLTGQAVRDRAASIDALGQLPADVARACWSRWGRDGER